MEFEQQHANLIEAIQREACRTNELLSIIASVSAAQILRPPGSQAIVNASGFATIAYRNFPGGVEKIYVVEKVFMYTNTTASTINAGVFVMDGLPAGGFADNPNALAAALNPLYQKDATNQKIAGGDELAPIYVKGGEFLVFQWAGLNQNDLCVASWQGKLAWQGQG